MRRWVETAPPWPSLDRAKALWARVSPRLDQLRFDFDRVLVVGVIGGTGTGKSTLLNALVGRRICPAGDVQRPDDAPPRRPCASRHRYFLPEARRLPARSPSSRDSAAGEHDPDRLPRSGYTVPKQRQLAIRQPKSRPASPRPSAMRHAALHRHGPEIQNQTPWPKKSSASPPAARWCSCRPTRRSTPTSPPIGSGSSNRKGSTCRTCFASTAKPHWNAPNNPPPCPAEFAQLVDFLHAELPTARAIAFCAPTPPICSPGFSRRCNATSTAHYPALKNSNSPSTASARRLFAMRTRISKTNYAATKASGVHRLLREVTRRWSWGPFTGFLRLLGSARSLLNFFPAIRARGLGPMLVTGGIGMGKAVADRVRQSWSERSWLAAAEMGIDPGDISQSQSVLAGFAHKAGIDVATDPNAGPLLEETATRWTQQIESALNQIVERRVAGRAGRLFHGILELLFIALPAVLLWRLGLQLLLRTPLARFDAAALWSRLPAPIGALDPHLGTNLERLPRLAIAARANARPDHCRQPTRLRRGAITTTCAIRRAGAAIRQHLDKQTQLAADIEHLRHDLDSAGPTKLSRLHSPTVSVGSA